MIYQKQINRYDSGNIKDSSVTNTSTELKYFHKYHLSQCRSILSVELNGSTSFNRLEQKLLGDYLISKNYLRERQKCLATMRRIYQKKNKQKSKCEESENQCWLIQLPPQFQPSDKQMMQYFFRKWIYSMGYRTQSNKRLILERIHLTMPSEKITEGIQFYETMGEQSVIGVDRFWMLESICEGGWEQFIWIMKGKIMKNN